METSLGGNRFDFPETRWSRILAARDPQPLEELLRTYWKPIYAAIRRFHGLPVEDAKDATQEFLAVMLERGLFEDVRPEGGRFRSYLKTAIRRFMIDRHRTASAQKRAPLDVEEMERLLRDAPPPDRVFDLEWRRTVLDAAHARIRPDHAEMLRADGSYREIAKRLAISESDVRNRLHAARVALREAVVEVLRESVSTREELEAELHDLFEC